MTGRLSSGRRRDDRPRQFRQARAGSIGASDVPDLVRRTKTGWSATRANLMALKVLERLTGVAVETYQCKAMADGIEKQPEATAAYAFVYDVTVEQPPPPGLVPHPLIYGAHASPDGLVGDHGLVEVKCPQLAAHLDTLLSEKVERDYRIQIQWQLACTGRDWCDYVCWQPELSALDAALGAASLSRSDYHGRARGRRPQVLGRARGQRRQLQRRYDLAEAA